MAEPIGPEAYLAIAASLHNAVNSCRGKKRAKENDITTNISKDSSKSTRASPTDELLSYSGLRVGNDGYVQWAMGNPEHPSNWSRKRKAYDFALILFSEFFMSAISAGGTPASLDGAEVLGQKMEVRLVAFTSMYLLGQALGALLLPPYSDRVGRRTLYIGSAFLYSVFCIPVAATSDIAGVFAGRLVTGVISAVPAITTRLSIEDLFDAEGRMWALFSWALVTNLGLVLGPVYASYVAASLDWRWPFYLASIIVAVTGMLMYFIRESHSSLLLERTVAVIRFHRPDLTLRTAPVAPRSSIVQPLILLATRPNVFLQSLANAFSTALLYLFAIAFPLIYAHYAWSRQKTRLIFLFIAVGLFFSTLTRFHDRHSIRKNCLPNHRLTPEKTLFGLAIGAPALAMGLWWFAWTIPGPHVKTLSWPASALSLILVGYGINEHTTVLPRYILNPHSHSHFQPHNNNNRIIINNNATSAFAALLTLRALLSAIFPLFTTQMFGNLDTNTAASVLAAIATAFCLLPFFLIKNFRAGWRRSGGPGAIDGGNDERVESALEKENDTKPKKTVRWPVNETDSDSGTDTGFSETETERMKSADVRTGYSAIITLNETTIRDQDQDDDRDERNISTIPRLDTTDADTITPPPPTTIILGNPDTPAPQHKPKKEKSSKGLSRLDAVHDAGSLGIGTGSLGMEVDVERVVGFPYL